VGMSSPGAQVSKRGVAKSNKLNNGIYLVDISKICYNYTNSD